MRRSPVVAFVALLLVIGGPLLVAPWFGWGRKPAGVVMLSVPKGATLTAVADAMYKKGLIDSPRQFRMLARLFGGDASVQAGDYRLRRSDAWRTYLWVMQKGRVAAERITIPEGLASVQVVDLLSREKQLAGPLKVPAEGSVLPETYDFTAGEPRQKLVSRMERAMATTLAELWAKRSGATVVKSPHEAIILASIVEKETGKAAERRMVAGVYSNRLRIGMKLDADPTVIYPITQGRPLGRRIRKSELSQDSGYNTYLKPGLPAGPIANPGRASIAAVLDPAPTKALYFVADGSGGHVFADTLAEHNANVAKWFALRRQRGEM